MTHACDVRQYTSAKCRISACNRPTSYACQAVNEMHVGGLCFPEFVVSRISNGVAFCGTEVENTACGALSEPCCQIGPGNCQCDAPAVVETGGSTCTSPSSGCGFNGELACNGAYHYRISWLLKGLLPVQRKPVFSWICIACLYGTNLV
jgi:hypothetical protein